MTYWQGVLSRISVPGLILLALGVVLCLGAERIAGWIWKQGGDRATTPLKVAGLVLAAVGALVCLKFIPI